MSHPRQHFEVGMDSESLLSSSNPPEREPIPAPPRVMLLVCFCSVMTSLGMTNWMASRSMKIWRGRLETVSEIVPAPHATRIRSIELKPGDSVTAGDVLMLMDTSTLDDQITAQQQLIEQLNLKLEQLEAKAGVELSLKMKDIDDDIHQSKLKSADLLKEKYLADFSNVAWNDFLTQDNPVHVAAANGLQPFVHSLPIPDESRIRALLQQEAAHNASEVYAAQVELVETRLEELNAMKSALPEQIRAAHGIPLLQHKLETAEAKLAELEDLQSDSAIVSPAFGTVGVYRKSAGDEVLKGEPLVEILDRARQYLSVSIPSSDLHLFAVEREVTVEFSGFATRTGVITEIPPQSSTTNQHGESCFEVKITPVDKSWPELPFGSNVAVSIRE